MLGYLQIDKQIFKYSRGIQIIKNDVDISKRSTED